MRWLFFIVTFMLAGMFVASKIDVADAAPVPIVVSHVTYVENHLSEKWPVAEAVDWIDAYTGDDWVVTDACPADARRCVRLSEGPIAGGTTVIDGTTYYTQARTHDWSSKTPFIEFDPRRGVAPKTEAKRKIVLCHELGHTAGLDHDDVEGNLMYFSSDEASLELDEVQRSVLKSW